MTEFKDLKYAELRKLAKAAGIKANQKHEVLVAELKRYYESQQKKEGRKSVQDQGKKSLSSGHVANSQSKNARSIADQGEHVQNTANTPIESIRKSTSSPAVKKVVTPQAKLYSNSLGSDKKNKIQTPGSLTSSGMQPSDVCKESPKVARWEKKLFTSTNMRNGPSTTGRNSPVLKGTASPESNRSLNKRKSTDCIEKPDQQTKRRRSTFEKAPTQDLKTPKVKETPVEQKQSTTRKKSPRSPGVKEMLGAMKSEMSDKEMKESLLSVLDKNVQDKCKTSEADLCSTNSNIPRFAAFLKKRQESKAITPGNKDWSKIHKKNFEKFDSIDVYLEKKRKRAEEITSSAKKAKIISEEVSFVMKKLKSHKTPEGNENKVKITRKSNPNKTTPFQPTVCSTKNLNFNFNFKSPKTLPRISPRTVLGKEKSENKMAARKSAGAPTQLKSTATPFKFTGGNTLNTTVTSTKKTFNLKESLAKPLGYKPHKGKLKPYENKGPTYFNPVSATKTSKNRENIKTSVAQRRANKKMNSIMSRRGIQI